MTWKQNKNWNPKAQAWKQAWPSEQQEKQKPKKEDNKAFFVGYDGRKVAVPNGQASSSGSTSSAATAATNAQVLEENRKLRDVFKLLLDKDAGKEVGKNPTELVEECKKLVHNPRESLRERQRELNKEKKSINRAEKLESVIKEKEENFARWKAGFMEGLRLEEKRYEEEMKALKDELKNVEDGPETHSMEQESDGEQGARALAEDLSQVKAQMDQMATYFEVMEKRNQQMVQEMNHQVQSLVAVIRTSQRPDMVNQSSPQLVRPPGQRLDMERTPVREERSRSPAVKRNSIEVVQEDENLETFLKGLLEGLKEEHRKHVLTIVEAEPESYSTKEAVEILVQQVMMQASGHVSLDSMDSPSGLPVTMARNSLLPFGGDGKQQKGAQERGGGQGDPRRSSKERGRLGDSCTRDVGRQAMSPTGMMPRAGMGYDYESVSFGASADSHVFDGCANFQGCSISGFVCEDDSGLHLFGQGESSELLDRNDFETGFLEMIWDCATTVFWFVAGSLCFPFVAFLDFPEFFRAILLGICVVTMCVLVLEELGHISRCAVGYASGRRIRPIPSFAEICQAFVCQWVGIACNYMILEFDVEVKCEKGVGETALGIDLLVRLCRYQELIFFVLGLLSLWGWRLDQTIKYPGRAIRADRRVPHRKRNPKTRRSFVAWLLLCNLLCCEGIGVANRICENIASGINDSHEMTQERCPFRPYEDFADEGDLSRPEGCDDSFEEHFLEGSNGQHGASRDFQSFEGTRHAPGDCRANSTPIDMCCPGVVQSFVPIFGENKVTKNFTPDSGDYTTGENTATPNAFDKDGCCIAFPWEEPNDYTVLMQRFPIEQQRVPFARASERGLSIRHALELSRKVFTPIWMLEGRDVAFEYFRSAEQGIWQKKVLGWKFLGYDQEIGLPFSI